MMNITIVESFHLFFIVNESKAFYILTDKQGEKIRVNKRELKTDKQLNLSEVLNNIDFIKSNKIKESASASIKENFKRLQVSANRLEKFLKVEAYSYKSLLREAIGTKTF